MDFLFDLLGRNTPPAVYAGGSFNNASEILPPEGQMQDNEPTIELDVNECQPRKRVEEALETFDWALRPPQETVDWAPLCPASDYFNEAVETLNVSTPSSPTPANIHVVNNSQPIFKCPQEWSSSVSSAASELTVTNTAKQSTRKKHESRKIFKIWYTKHKNWPYPNPKELETFSSKTGLTIQKVQDWFRNTRKRDKSLPGRSFPQMDHYRESDHRQGSVPLVSLEAMVQRDENPSFNKRGSSNGHVLCDNRDTHSQFFTAGTETGHSTARTLSRSAIEQPRRQGKRIVDQPHFALERDGDKIYQCRYCNRGFDKPRDWGRHEEIHNPSKRFFCMKDNIEQNDALGNPKCPFCGEADSSDQHMNKVHKYHPEKRPFSRPDNLMRHWKEFHHATLPLPESWTAPKAISDELCWCGFCAKYQATRLICDKHVRTHFEDGKELWDMTRWIMEPKDAPEPVSVFEKSSWEIEFDALVGIDDCEGF